MGRAPDQTCLFVHLHGELRTDELLLDDFTGLLALLATAELALIDFTENVEQFGLQLVSDVQNGIEWRELLVGERCYKLVLEASLDPSSVFLDDRRDVGRGKQLKLTVEEEDALDLNLDDLQLFVVIHGVVVQA